jgi:hypothetical protein
MPRVIAVKKVGMLTSLFVLGLFAAACGGAGGSGKSERPAGGGRTGATGAVVPAGYTPVAAGQVSVAYPPGWRRAPAPQGWTLALALHTGKRTVAQLGVISDVPQVNSVRLVAAGAFAGVQINAAEVQRGTDRELRIPGAASALRVDYTYINVVNGRRTGEAARGTDVSVVFGGQKAATVRITGLQSSLAPDMVDQIVRTISTTS